NYTEHVAESAKTLDTSADLPREPVIFSKPPTTVVGPGDPIVHNAAITQQLDWEVELAAVIGSTAKGVSREDALKHVFGYTVLIDVSARDCRRAGQWIYSKGQDSFAPMGPCIVTADEIPDPQTLDLTLSLNGVQKQSSNTAYMLFKVDELIADISKGITLEPGDIIATGTPAGVGAGMDPQEWMWPGDTDDAEVVGIGKLRHPVVAACRQKSPPRRCVGTGFSLQGQDEAQVFASPSRTSSRQAVERPSARIMQTSTPCAVIRTSSPQATV